MGRRDQDLPALVGALAGTRAPEVKAAAHGRSPALPDPGGGTGRRPRAREPGQLRPPRPSRGSRASSEAYGLPAILHRLGQGRATGVLTLRPREAAAPATFAFDQGRLRSARWGRREGADAAYQILERPFAGTFSFESGAAPGAAGAASLPALETLIKEGMRRATELRRTAAVVPGDARLEATGAAPSTVPSEPDYELIVALWERACKQVSVAEMEADLAADSFRIRHALAHWLEEGALRVATPEAEPLPPSQARSEGRAGNP